MRSEKLIRKILIILAMCLVLAGASSFAFAVNADQLPADAVIIGFIDSGIAPYNLDESHILEGKNYAFEGKDTVDRIGHGTKTAGMVLGSSGGSVKGTCPQAYVVPLVVVDKYASGATKNGGNEALVAAIYDAVNVYSCDIINLSLSIGEESPELKAAVDYAAGAGVIMVCAAGNTPGATTFFYPAHYDNVIAIGSSDGSSIASFSSTLDADFFYEGKDVAVVSNKAGKAAQTDSGSSFSCAAVSGIIASWLYREPELTLDDIRATLAANPMEGTANILDINRETALVRLGGETAPVQGIEEAASAPDRVGSLQLTDIQGHWCQTFAEYAVNNRLVDPYADGSFRPDVKVTRGLVVDALFRLAGGEKVLSDKSFPDVSEELWCHDAVIWAAESGIVSGYTSGNFGPDDNITREQLCTIFCKYASFMGIELKETAQSLEFTDAADIASYAAYYVRVCQRAGIVSGYDNGSFNPKGNATRAQFCAMLMNFVK